MGMNPHEDSLPDAECERAIAEGRMTESDVAYGRLTRRTD